MATRSNASLDNKNEHKGLRLDESDLKNIENALTLYEKMNPRGKVKILEEDDPKTGKPIQYIEYCNIADHLEYTKKSIIPKHMQWDRRVGKFDDPIRLQISIPPSLEAWLNKGYPKLFTDPVQTKQFLTRFPYFDLTKI